jgi:hypothetical protein
MVNINPGFTDRFFHYAIDETESVYDAFKDTTYDLYRNDPVPTKTIDGKPDYNSLYDDKPKFSDEEIEEEFAEKYKNLRKTFELLGPDEIKLEYFEDYKWISAIYTFYMKMVIQKPAYEGYVQKYYDKTIRFIHRATEIEKLEKELPIFAFDGEYLKALEEKDCRI